MHASLIFNNPYFSAASKEQNVYLFLFPHALSGDLGTRNEKSGEIAGRGDRGACGILGEVCRREGKPGEGRSRVGRTSALGTRADGHFQ